MPFRTLRSFARGTPRGLFGRSGWMIDQAARMGRRLERRAVETPADPDARTRPASQDDDLRERICDEPVISVHELPVR